MEDDLIESKIFRKNKNNVPMPESNAHDLLHGLHDFLWQFSADRPTGLDKN